MYPHAIDNDRLTLAINESRRLIEETKRLLQSSAEILVPPLGESDPEPVSDDNLQRGS